jgi:hypothetical protein
MVRFPGSDRMIACGHPPANSELPPSLGMIESRDAGKTWSEISGLGKDDFHAQFSGDSIVAGVFGAAALNVSTDDGKAFEERAAPDPLVDLEADPDSPGRLIASSQRGLITSADGGWSWRTHDPIPSMRFAWLGAGALYRIDREGPSSSAPTAARRGRNAVQPVANHRRCTPTALTTSTSPCSTAPSRSPTTPVKTWTARVTPPA